MNDDHGRECEGCKALPPGSQFNLHDYCAYCSKNLCEECMKKPCKARASGGTHEAEDQ